MFDELLHARMPGSRVGGEHRIQNKCLLLLYRDVHILSKEYKNWIENEVVIKLFNKKLNQVSLVRKKAKVDGKIRKYTYVILCISETIRTRNYKAFNWKEEQPEIRMLVNEAQLNAAVSYLEDWTDNLPSPEVSALAEPEFWNLEGSHNTEFRDTANDCSSWYHHVLTMMNQQYESDKTLAEARLHRSIHTVLCTNAHAESFLKLLKSCKANYHNSDRFLILSEVPNREDSPYILEAERSNGWTREHLIFNITHHKTIGDIHRTVVEAIDQHICCSVWLFTSKIPDATVTTICHQKFYHIEESEGSSKLYLLRDLEVLKMLYEQVKTE